MGCVVCSCSVACTPTGFDMAGTTTGWAQRPGAASCKSWCKRELLTFQEGSPPRPSRGPGPSLPLPYNALRGAALRAPAGHGRAAGGQGAGAQREAHGGQVGAVGGAELRGERERLHCQQQVGAPVGLCGGGWCADGCRWVVYRWVQRLWVGEEGGGVALLCSCSDRVRVERRGGACSLPRRTMALGWCGRRCCDAAPHGMERPWKRPLNLLHSNLARPSCIKVAGTIFLPISPPFSPPIPASQPHHKTTYSQSPTLPNTHPYPSTPGARGARPPAASRAPSATAPESGGPR